MAVNPVRIPFALTPLFWYKAAPDFLSACVIKGLRNS